MLSAGARQRHHHPVRCPTRQLAAAHRRQRRIRQARQQLQPPADPAHVAAASSRHVVLGQALPLHQFAQQQGLLDAGEWTILRARQHT
jgi:hypothetical protein